MGADHLEYQPDFVAETDDAIYMLEPKAAQRDGRSGGPGKEGRRVEWCKNATDYAGEHGGKPWKYVLIPHDAIAENMTLKGLVQQYGG